ncbi:MAG: hypothetical protein ACQESB_05495 [Elusimicrobiota bacterium]
MRAEKFKKIKAALALMLAASFTLLFFQAGDSNTQSFRLLRDNMSYSSMAAINISRNINRAEPGPSSEERDNKREAGSPVFLMTGLIPVNSLARISVNLNRLLFSFLLFFSLFKGSVKNKNPESTKYYMTWRFKFLTPLQKIIFQLFEYFDTKEINKINYALLKARVFKRGFFYHIAWKRCKLC